MMKTSRRQAVGDPVPGNGDFTILVNRNGPAVNPGSGDFDMPVVSGDIADLFGRSAPATNPGSGDFDMPVVGGSISQLLTRNAPLVNPGLVDFDMPTGGDLSDLFDRNGPRQTIETDLAASAVGDDLLFDLGSSIEDFSGFEVV
jgi:hypothetical protein